MWWSKPSVPEEEHVSTEEGEDNSRHFAPTAVLYEVVQSVTVDAEQPAKLVVPVDPLLLLVDERAGQSVTVDAQDVIVCIVVV